MRSHGSHVVGYDEESLFCRTRQNRRVVGAAQSRFLDGDDVKPGRTTAYAAYNSEPESCVRSRGRAACREALPEVRQKCGVSGLDLLSCLCRDVCLLSEIGLDLCLMRR